MVFGDKALFDGAPIGATMVGYNCQKPRWYRVWDDKLLFSDGPEYSWTCSDTPFPGCMILAMREEVQYEPIQGEQALFNDAKLETVAVYASDTYTKEFSSIDALLVFLQAGRPSVSRPVIAMRKIKD